jgi:hypothetical protein
MVGISRTRGSKLGRTGPSSGQTGPKETRHGFQRRQNSGRECRG